VSARETEYSTSQIQVLEGLEPVRKRPGMYIGGTGSDGFHHLLWEVVDNSVDEAMNGHATGITVTLHADGRSATVVDNGRGIPVDIHPQHRISGVELVLTRLHAGGKFGGGGYKTSGGLHGVGASVVNALSEDLQVVVRRGGAEHRQAYRRGKPLGPLGRVGEARGSGTTLRFTPDREIFGDLGFDADVVRERLEQTAFLHRGLKIVFRDEAHGTSEEFKVEGGVRDYVGHLARKTARRPIHPEPFLFERQNGVRIEVALAWTDATREMFVSFANGIPTAGGGTHEQGARDAIVRAVRTYIETHELQPRGLTLTADDIREGALVVVSVFLEDPQFQGQTKDKLNNPEIRSVIEAPLRGALEQHLNSNRSTADLIVARVIQAARARLASRTAEEQVRRRSATTNRLTLPGKLADCSLSDPEVTELFIVEGDSAGGSARQGRDREFQAILPLRGKVLNTEQASLAKILENAEISNIVSALGCGIGKDFNRDRLRYGKVILLMDADSDGHHIATLLLTFFFRHLPALIEHGHLFLAQPPLYRIDVGQQTWWALDDAEKERVLRKLPQRAQPEISRFKGLGEMLPKTLYETTLDPKRRHLLQVSVPGGEQVATDQVIADLMGKDAAPRFREIMERIGEVDGLDV